MQHIITTDVLVPMTWDDTAGKWRLAPAALDGSELDVPEPPEHCSTDKCECDEQDECDAVSSRAVWGHIPSGRELAEMIKTATANHS
ncbi:hypothetical protein FB384_004899 [Prauserella sediminis]|uniref:Uncharacterized protein n=1 Tax=Prauserella sediminis TaxID=577680 RepID=A0A839XRY6_9PSEU|nr:hypothetical protein [Prauserella sediminis]MBB3665940.1 hypothetical protein [Prauserella sediminis]